MINFKKMDDKDFVFIAQNDSKKDDLAFSDFLKSRKSKRNPTQRKSSVTANKRAVTQSKS